MKGEGFSSTSRYIATEYLKVDPQVLVTIIERLLRVEEELTGEFLLIGENYYLTPKGLKIFASYMAVAGNRIPGAEQDQIDRLWDDLIKMGAIDDSLYLRLVARGLICRRMGEQAGKQDDSNFTGGHSSADQ